jgi:hypothetical protein
MGEAVSRESKQTVINVQIVDIDRFNVCRSNGKRVEIPDGQIAKRIAFETKIGLQVFSGGVTQYNLPADC